MDTILIVIIAALLVGLTKGGLGPMAGALVTPLLSFTMPVTDAIGLALMLHMIGDYLAVPVYWRQWDTATLRLTWPAAVIGVLMGGWLLANLPEDVLRRILGGFALLAVIYKLASDRLQAVSYTPRDWHGRLAGWGAGFGSALANVGAPPITIYMLLKKTRPVIFVATTLYFFIPLNMLKLPLFIAADVIEPQNLLDVIWVLPLIPAGVWLGRAVIKRISATVFEWLMIVLLAYAGVALLVST
jgi:uncharacterized protein